MEKSPISLSSPYLLGLPSERIARSSWLLLALLLVGAAAPMQAVSCAVPGDRATIQLAIDDLSCTDVQLSNQNYVESIVVNRSLTVAGPPGGTATVQGRVQVAGAGSMVVLQDLDIANSCTLLSSSLDVRPGAQLVSNGVDIDSAPGNPCPPPPHLIFGDGFETGDTTQWSSG